MEFAKNQYISTEYFYRPYRPPKFKISKNFRPYKYIINFESSESNHIGNKFIGSYFKPYPRFNIKIHSLTIKGPDKVLIVPPGGQ